MRVRLLRSVSLALALLSTDLAAAEYQGLWVGSAALTAVTEATPRASDLAFDLALVWHRNQESLVAAAAQWRYNDSGGDLGTGWRSPTFPDAGWAESAAPLQLGAGQPAVYFRRTFDVADPFRHSELRLRLTSLQPAGGAAVYLNGTEVHRVRLTADAAYGDCASLPAASEPLEVTVPTTLLRAGANTVAVEVHRGAAADPVLSFGLALTGTLAIPSVQSLVAPASSWAYDDSGQDLGTAWRTPAFSDADWRDGTAPFEFGESSRSTPLVYFRKAFDVDAPSALPSLELRLRRDDGAVVYLNGTEVLRSNLPQGEVTRDTAPVLALTADQGQQWVTKTLSSSSLVGGRNVLAVEVHQHPSELGGATPAGAVTATPATFDLRLLVHVDSAGQARLLKEVIQVVDAEQGVPVLLTDPAKVPLATYTGIALRDGVPVGRRMSAAGFDFSASDEDSANPGCLKLTGAFGATLAGAFAIRPLQPTNPFLHRHHPDHDNWDARYEAYVPEAYEVGRTLTLHFSPEYPPGWSGTGGQPRPPPPLGWTSSIFGGTYVETLSGLHRDPIEVRGTFLLQRASTVASLNP